MFQSWNVISIDDVLVFWVPCEILRYNKEWTKANLTWKVVCLVFCPRPSVSFRTPEVSCLCSSSSKGLTREWKWRTDSVDKTGLWRLVKMKLKKGLFTAKLPVTWTLHRETGSSTDSEASVLEEVLDFRSQVFHAAFENWLARKAGFFLSRVCRLCLRPKADDVLACGRRSSSSHARKKPLVPTVTVWLSESEAEAVG